ncbi:MAG: hypothetical protein U5K43_02515 [Halofilum sp. (in: g-proteobacteria)]|nr:hypothetical protein [Halofilum sp. (in: g-proteobacteria)]
MARLHGGCLRLEDNGPGLRVRLQLPPDGDPGPRQDARDDTAAA